MRATFTDKLFSLALRTETCNYSSLHLEPSYGIEPGFCKLWVEEYPLRYTGNFMNNQQPTVKGVIILLFPYLVLSKTFRFGSNIIGQLFIVALILWVVCSEKDTSFENSCRLNHHFSERFRNCLTYSGKDYGRKVTFVMSHWLVMINELKHIKLSFAEFEIQC